MKKSFYRWLDRTCLAGETAIIMYHGLTDKDGSYFENYHGKHLHIAKFEEHLSFLQQHYKIIPLEQYLRQRTNKTASGGPFVVLSFDDGYESNYTLGFPVLKKMNVPASIFLATDFIDRRSFFWANRIEYALLNTKEKDLNVRIQDRTYAYDLSETPKRQQAVDSIKPVLKTLLGDKDRIHCTEQIEQQLNAALSFDNDIPAIHRPMSWDQIREMNASGLVTFGSHTCSHAILGECSEKDIAEEISVSKQRIEEELKTPCHLFCYPYGGEGTFNAATAEALRQAGYSCALTTLTGTNNRTSDPYLLKRLGTSNLLEMTHFENNLLLSRKKLRQIRKKISTLIK